MKLSRTIFSIIFIFIMQFVFGQNTFNAIIKDESTGMALVGVNVVIKSINTGGTTDINGILEINNIPDGTFSIEFSYIGYEPYQLIVSFPLKNKEYSKTIWLEPATLELHGITVTTTRTNSRIEDVPVRVEVLGREEVDEEIAIRPGNISKLLGETSGIQVQQTSVTSGNISFRIQGLPGKYTQLLKDGFPIYSGFSSGLSLLQIPPLDLEQVEVIKGSSSTLYGGDAIAGIVNLVSKTPAEVREWFVLLNQTHKGGRDISTYYSKKSDKVGITLLASGSTQKAFDVNRDGFTDLPYFRQFTIDPKLFYYFNDATSLMICMTSSFENRMGGDILAVEKGPDSLHSFIEKNKSSRYTSRIKFEKKFDRGNILTLKNSLNSFQRNISSNSTNFREEQLSSFSELSYLLKTERHNTVLGMNFITDTFNEDKAINSATMDENSFTAGAFVQDDWNFSKKFILQTGLRSDYHNKYGYFILPRFSVLYKLTNKIYVRTGGGLGYKTPNTITDDAEAKSYNEILPIASDIKAESSLGMNIDINYKTVLLEDIGLTMNQAFYFTQVYNALIPQPDSLSSGILSYQNAAAPIETKGFDTNIYFSLDELVLFIDYTYTDAQKKYDKTNSRMSLTPKHKLNLTLTYEEENSWRAGIEAFYTGKQYLTDQTQTRDFWTTGVMVQKMFRHFSIIGNVENIFDIRQTRFEDVVIPPYNDPAFRPVYAPLDGIVANIALKIRL